MSLGERIARLRKQRDWTQDDWVSESASIRGASAASRTTR